VGREVLWQGILQGKSYPATLILVEGQGSSSSAPSTKESKMAVSPLIFFRCLAE